MDRGAWRAGVRGVAESRRRPSDWAGEGGKHRNENIGEWKKSQMNMSPRSGTEDKERQCLGREGLGNSQK